MTPAAAVLFVFVTHGAARAPIDDVLAACLRALPAGTRPVARTVAEAPADAAVIGEAGATGAAAAVIISWSDATLTTVDLRAVVGLPAQPRWVARTVRFTPRDELAERERALGLVIASIVDETVESRPPAAAGAVSPDAVAPKVPSPPVISAAAAEAPGAITASTAPVVAVAPVPAGGERAGPWAMEAALTTALESGTDPDDTIGGALGVRWFVRPSLAVRAGAGFRLTQRDAADRGGAPDLTQRALLGSLGLAWSTAGFGGAGRLGAALRADLLLAQQTVRLSAGAVRGERAYWSGGADALAEVGVGVTRGAMLLMGLGLEEMFTEAEVVVQDQSVAMLRRPRLVLQLGLLSRL